MCNKVERRFVGRWLIEEDKCAGTGTDPVQNDTVKSNQIKSLLLLLLLPLPLLLSSTRSSSAKIGNKEPRTAKIDTGLLCAVQSHISASCPQVLVMIMPSRVDERWPYWTFLRCCNLLLWEFFSSAVPAVDVKLCVLCAGLGLEISAHGVLGACVLCYRSKFSGNGIT